MEVIISLIRWSRFYPEGNGRVIIDKRPDRVLADLWRMAGIAVERMQRCLLLYCSSNWARGDLQLRFGRCLRI